MSCPSVDTMLNALGWKFDAASITDRQIFKLKMYYLIDKGVKNFLAKRPEKDRFGVAYVYISHEVPAPWGFFTQIF